MKIEQLKNRLLRFFSWEESHEDIVLDHRIAELYSEIREWELNNLPKLSQGFEERVLAHLSDIHPDESSWKDRWIPSFLESRPIQYGMTFGMVCLLAVVVIGRSQSSFLEDDTDTAGVIIKNTQYLDQPSSVEYADSYHRRVFVDSVRKKEGSLETLSNLENYFNATGKKGVAREIRYFIQEVSH